MTRPYRVGERLRTPDTGSVVVVAREGRGWFSCCRDDGTLETIHGSSLHRETPALEAWFSERADYRTTQDALFEEARAAAAAVRQCYEARLATHSEALRTTYAAVRAASPYT